MTIAYRISSYRARNLMPLLPGGKPTIEATERELAAIFKNQPTGKPGRPAAPRRHLDADLRISPYHRGERCDAAGRSFDICRTLIITHHGKPVAEATITRVTPFARFTRVHFIAPTSTPQPQLP